MFNHDKVSMNMVHIHIDSNISGYQKKFPLYYFPFIELICNYTL